MITIIAVGLLVGTMFIGSIRSGWGQDYDDRYTVYGRYQ